MGRDGSESQGRSVAQVRSPLRFDRLVVQKQGLPHLSPRASPGLIANYQDQAKQSALTIVIDQLLENKCIRKMSETECGFFSRVFLVPKRAGGWRLVIDLSVLNSYLAQVTFEMDTLAKVKLVARQGMWATSLDLSDAYHHVPIREDCQRFLCFQVGDMLHVSSPLMGRSA